jgi:hypothetical protein
MDCGLTWNSAQDHLTVLGSREVRRGFSNHDIENGELASRSRHGKKWQGIEVPCISSRGTGPCMRRSFKRERFRPARARGKCSPKVVQRFASARPPHCNAPVDFLRKTA